MRVAILPKLIITLITMRKIAFILSVVAGLCISNPSALANGFADGGDDGGVTEIPIINGEGDSGTSGPVNRAPSYVPIAAEYWDAVSSIIVFFRNDLGTVSIAIENLSTGSCIQTVVNARQGVFPFRISGEEGIYRISFTLSNGHKYTGMFELE